MKKLSPAERRNAYMTVAEVVAASNYSCGACHLLERHLNSPRLENERYRDMLIQVFPEYNLFKPEPDEYVWWEGEEEAVQIFCRSLALLFAFELTKYAKE